MEKPTETKEPEAKVETQKETIKPEVKETVKEEPKKIDVDIEALKSELAEANEKAKAVETLTSSIQTIQADTEKKDATIKEYEDLLGTLVETKIAQIPAEYKDLVPDNMDLKQKLSWLEKAEAKGLFNKEEKKKPNVEVGKPMNVDVQKVDTSKLSASDLFKMAYNTVKK